MNIRRLSKLWAGSKSARQIQTSAWIWAIVATALVLTHSAQAEDPKPDPAKPAEAPKEQPQAESSQDILKLISQLSNRPPTGATRDEFINNFKTTQREVIGLADKLLAHPDAAGEKGDKLAAQAIQTQLLALRLLTRLGDAKANADTKELLAKHGADARPLVAELVAQAALQQRFTPGPDADVPAVKAMVEDAKQHFATVKPLKIEHAMIVKKLADALEQRDASAEAADALKSFGELLSKSEDPRAARAGRQLIGTARRVGLMGQPMDVYGTQLDGKAIDWASYKGKVVLVDFWATWCPPCVAEVPNIIRNYEKYHDRGFEVIGVSVDDDRKPVDEFIAQKKVPWMISLDSDFKASGKTESLAEYYGITGIPTAILIDKEGKVVSLRARGPELGRLLATLIGPADGEKKEEKQEKTEENKN